MFVEAYSYAGDGGAVELETTPDKAARLVAAEHFDDGTIEILRPPSTLQVGWCKYSNIIFRVEFYPDGTYNYEIIEDENKILEFDRTRLR